MKWLIGLLGKVPGSLITKLAIVGLVYVVGMAHGQLIENRRLVEKEQQASADRMRENHLALFEEFKKRNAEYKAHIEQQQGASNAAYDVLAKGKATAEQNLRAARAALAKALETPRETPTINIPADPGCVMPPGVRQTINNYIASINSAPAIGNSLSTTTGLPLGPAASDSVLACRELASGVIDILNHDAAMIAEIMSWRTWATEALK